MDTTTLKRVLQVIIKIKNNDNFILSPVEKILEQLQDLDEQTIEAALFVLMGEGCLLINKPEPRTPYVYD